MIYYKIFIFTSLLILNFGLRSQTDTSSHKEGVITIHASDKIQKLVNYRKQWSDSLNAVTGYRIQIFSESGPKSKTLAMDEKARFMLMYKDIPTYMVSQMPYFKIRVGDFKDRLDAFRFHQEIKNIYPNSFIVPDQVSIR